MAGAALLRSVATRTMALAPPRLPSALEHHGRLPASSGGPWLSRFSTSTGSTPPSVNLRGPQTHNKELPSWYRPLVAFNKGLDMAILLMFAGFAYVHFCVNPALDRMEANLDAQLQASVTMREEIKKSHERTRAILHSDKESQIEATDVSEV
ncbi:hypothetical protein E2562_003328 [Oryza meyeriana var. granulata]|uniref:Uncharacterized protein n=1 Tax=Oryza meyeriana var. granulata TaxID=110450 RepID=A0A6G1EFA6_9ORYZ|nr:hypothetical protein E2562_003328 [Oryza meyeriana var. granulata]KAF0923105.1 hypothetical protein E2562_003328 [Oryza meyeriana var. granulata]